jgi:lysozyme family protein
MTEDNLIDSTMEREGLEYADQNSHPPTDQPTGPGGITLPVLSAYRNRHCTIQDLKALTAVEAREILRVEIRKDLAQFRFELVVFEPLRLQLLDFAWNSGVERAVRWMQRTVGLVGTQVTGLIDDRTISALNKLPPYLVNNALAAERAHAAFHGGVPEGYEAGVAHRAIEFVIPLDVPPVPVTMHA